MRRAAEQKADEEDSSSGDDPLENRLKVMATEHASIMEEHSKVMDDLDEFDKQLPTPEQLENRQKKRKMFDKPIQVRKV